MKRLLIFVFLMTGFVAVNAQHPQPPPPIKSMRVNPVVLSQDKNALTIYFYQNFGAVTVSIASKTGRSVYSSHIDTDSVSVISINSGILTDDVYILTIQNKDGILKEILFYTEE